jgi:hypothetical protein
MTAVRALGANGFKTWAYDRQSKVGKLDKALDEGQKRGWTIVDLRRQWKAVIAFDK